MKWYSDMLDALSEKVSWELGREVEVITVTEELSENGGVLQIDTVFWLNDGTTYTYDYPLTEFLEEHFEL